MIARYFWLANLIIFQLCWILAALFRDQSTLWLALLLALHFAFSPSKRNDLLLTLAAGVPGVLIDVLLVTTGYYSYNAEHQPIPPWMLAIWIIFLISIMHSLTWTTRVPVWIQSVLGATAGTASYYSANKLGAVELEQLSSLIVIAIAWGIEYPVFVLFAKRISQPITRSTKS